MDIRTALQIIESTLHDATGAIRMVAPHHFEIANRSGVVINANEETVLGLAALTPDHRRLSFVDNDATHWTATYVPSVGAIRLSPRFSQDEYIDLPVAALAEFHPH